MDTQTPQRRVTVSESSWTTCILSAMSQIGTQQQCWQQLVRHDAAHAASSHMTEDANIKIFRKTGSSRNEKQHVIECEYIHTGVNRPQITL